MTVIHYIHPDGAEVDGTHGACCGKLYPLDVLTGDPEEVTCGVCQRSHEWSRDARRAIGGSSPSPLRVLIAREVGVSLQAGAEVVSRDVADAYGCNWALAKDAIRDAGGVAVNRGRGRVVWMHRDHAPRKPIEVARSLLASGPTTAAKIAEAAGVTRRHAHYLLRDLGATMTRVAGGVLWAVP